MKKVIPTISKIGVLSALGFILFSVIPYATAGKHICTFFMAASAVILFIKGRFVVKNWNLATFIFAGLVLSALVSALFGSYPLESLDVFRKDTLPFAIAFLLLSSQRCLQEETTRLAKLAFWALICGYLIKEGLAVWDALRNDFFSVYEANSRVTPKYVDFFATDSIFYIPFLATAILYYQLSTAQKMLLGVATVIAVAFIMVSGSRTSFALMLPTIVLFSLARFWNNKRQIIFGAVLLVALAGILKPYVTNISLARLYTIFSVSTLKFGVDHSVSERQAIAVAVWDISKDQWFLGYGPGWKKLPRIANDKGYMERWQSSGDSIDAMKHSYFEFGEGRVNPHNFYLQTIFEVGVLGLLLYIGLLLSILVRNLRILYHKKMAVSVDVGMALSSIAFVLLTFVSGISGGIWLPPAMLVVFLWAQINQH